MLATLVQSSVMVPVEVVRQRQMIQTGGEGSYTVATIPNSPSTVCSDLCFLDLHVVLCILIGGMGWGQFLRVRCTL